MYPGRVELVKLKRPGRLHEGLNALYEQGGRKITNERCQHIPPVAAGFKEYHHQPQHNKDAEAIAYFRYCPHEIIQEYGVMQVDRLEDDIPVVDQKQ
jgi:hypothetical protein